jgi:5-enolpyruvylshikimate-3-phosphate synthase
MVLLAVAIVAAGVAGCFTDPTKSLRSGPALITMSLSYINLKAGDSVAVTGQVVDNQGNVFPATGATWTTSNANAATVRQDTIVVPGDYFSRAFVVGAALTAPDSAVITLSARGLTQTAKVVVHP